MELTSAVLAYVVVGLALALPVVAALLWRRAHETGVRRRVTGPAVRLLVIVLCQVLAVGAVFLHANRMFGFYNTWGELIGQPAGLQHDLPVPTKASKVVRIPISKNNPHPQGLVTSLPVPGASGPFANATVWLPPQYFEASQWRTRFPVLMMIASAHSNGGSSAKMFDPVTTMLPAITGGDASPFIVVYVGAEIAEGKDAECIDLPGVPNQQVLTTNVPDAVRKHYRASRGPGTWFVSGFSTGAYCAANLSMKYPQLFGAGAGFAPYFHPMFDNPSIVGDQPLAAVVASNSPLAFLQSGSLGRANFLSVMSKNDGQSWGSPNAPPEVGQAPADGYQFYALGKDHPGLEFLLLDGGGHNPQTYLRTTPNVLAWLGSHGL